MPVEALKAPDPLMLKVPWLTAKASVVVWAVVQLSVPVPILVMVTPEVPMLPLMLMTPVPTALKVGLFERPRPPMLRVAPLAAPKKMPTEVVFVIAPLMVLLPLAEKTAPVLSMPDGVVLVAFAMLMALAKLTPPDR